MFFIEIGNMQNHLAIHHPTTYRSHSSHSSDPPGPWRTAGTQGEMHTNMCGCKAWGEHHSSTLVSRRLEKFQDKLPVAAPNPLPSTDSRERQVHITHFEQDDRKKKQTHVGSTVILTAHRFSSELPKF